VGWWRPVALRPTTAPDLLRGFRMQREPELDAELGFEEPGAEAEAEEIAVATLF
jgi:hypothetical protein